MKSSKTVKSKAQRLLDKVISKETFLARNPSPEQIDMYDKIKLELQKLAKEESASKTKLPSKSKKAKAKPRKVAK